MAALAAARHGYGTARAEVEPRLGPQVVHGLVRMYEHEGPALPQSSMRPGWSRRP
ncbi:hypothetical protein [Yinghuangia aomiensis]